MPKLVSAGKASRNLITQITKKITQILGDEVLICVIRFLICVIIKRGFFSVN